MTLLLTGHLALINASVSAVGGVLSTAISPFVNNGFQEMKKTNLRKKLLHSQLEWRWLECLIVKNDRARTLILDRLSH